MTWQALFNAIRSRFMTLVEQAIPISVQYDNAEFTPPDASSWVHFTVLPGATDLEELGAQKTWRDTGTAVANVFVPLLLGDAAALAIAETIKQAFRGVSVGGVTYRSPSVRTVGATGGKWWQVSVSCPWYADETV